MQIGDYIVKPNSIRDENALIRFLESNDFTYANDFENNPLDREYLIVVNIIRRTYFRIDRYCLTKGPMPLADFYRRVRHRSCENIVRKRLYFEDGKLLYEGYAVNDRPYGFGTVYFANGNRYQEGIFDIKGLVEGREYYPDGKLKFEGIWRITTGYGPNAPKIGNFYDEDGKLVFSGKLEIIGGGVGYPMIKYPCRYRNIEKERPKIEYVRRCDLDDVML